MSVRPHALWSAGAAILLTTSRFALLAILARRLDQSTLGLFSYAQWLVDIGFLVATFGATGAASRYIAEYRSRPELLHAFVAAWRLPSLLLPMLGAVLAVSGGGITGAVLDQHGQAALLLWAIFSGMRAMQTSALTGMQRFDLVFMANLLAASVMIAGVAFIPIVPNDASRAFLIMAGSDAAGFAVGLLPVRRLSMGRANNAVRIDRSAITRYCLNMWITALLWSLVWSRGEVPLVRHLLGDAQLAKYSVALNLFGGAIAGIMLGVGGIAPQVTRYLGEDNMDQSVKLCRKVGDWQLVLSGSAAVILILLAPEFLHLAFGERYMAAAPTLSILAAALPALSFSMHNHLLQIQTGARFSRNTTLLGLVLLFGTALLMIPPFGIEGAAMARAGSLGILALVSMAIFSSRVGVSGVNRSGFAMIALTTAVTALLVLVLPEAPQTVRIIMAIAIPLAFAFLVRGLDGRAVIRSYLLRSE